MDVETIIAPVAYALWLAGTFLCMTIIGIFPGIGLMVLSAFLISFVSYAEG